MIIGSSVKKKKKKSRSTHIALLSEGGLSRIHRQRQHEVNTKALTRHLKKKTSSGGGGCDGDLHPLLEWEGVTEKMIEEIAGLENDDSAF